VSSLLLKCSELIFSLIPWVEVQCGEIVYRIWLFFKSPFVLAYCKKYPFLCFSQRGNLFPFPSPVPPSTGALTPGDAKGFFYTTPTLPPPSILAH